MDVRQASETSHGKRSPGNFEHQYLAELLFNVYNHHLMVKSVCCCCVRGSWLFSDLVTYMAFTLVTSIKELHTHIQGDINKPY